MSAKPVMFEWVNETPEQVFARVLAEADAAKAPDCTPIDSVEFRREAYGFTQAQMAQVLGMQPSHYSEFINGLRELPRRAMRRAIAIGVPGEVLMGASVPAPHVGDVGGEVAELRAEVGRLNAIINTPHADDFIQAVSIEAEHQRQRWGAEGDAGKTPADWFWLVGYLAGKALHSHAAGNAEKAEHHIITTAAACANWHRAVFGRTDMRPGHEDGIDAARAAQQGAEG